MRALARCAVLAALAAPFAACAQKPGTAVPSDGAAAVDDPGLLATLARAEDLRRAKDVPDDALHSHDAEARRRAARALARIGGEGAASALLRALEDEDRTVAAWAAYGLGSACKGHEEEYVRALAARAISFDDASAAAVAAPLGRDAIDVQSAIARAIGRCGGPTAESTLAAWVRRHDAWGEPAAYALGDVAAKRGTLGDDTMTALLEASASSGSFPGAPGAADAALYPFARLERVPDSFAPRVAKAALAKVARNVPSLGRAFAVRALGRTGPASAADVERVAIDRSFTPAERADAARALRGMDDAGHAAAADALAQLAPIDVGRVTGDDYGVLSSLVAALGAEVPKRSEAALFALASLSAPGNASVSLGRRLAELRCGAALALSKGAYDSEVLERCDAHASEASERARLAALVRRPLNGDRRNAWRAFTRSDHVKVREAALEAIALHPELGDVGRAALVEALGAKKGGIVSTAAEVISGHPDRVTVLADREKRAGTDPTAPPPTATPARTIDPAVGQALSAALARSWPEDLVETRAALLDAAVAVSLAAPYQDARAAAMADCHDRNATMRDRAAKALRDLGGEAPACAPPADAGAPAPETGQPLAQGTRVVFSTDAGDLAIVFEPSLAPIAATRFVALAKGGFYDGIVVHRVVPGFVAQLGDPDGDGYGGAGTLLRCETSPVPFGPLDVGVALAGRDTGSSQIFVTLARVPHLDGEYARVGRAEGDWWAVAEGDAIRSAKVQE